MIWKVPYNLWKGGDAWIVGGGPSVAKEFEIPINIVHDVLTAKKHVSVYSPFMQSIHGKHVIGVNAAYQIGNWIDVITFGDTQFFKQHEKKLKEFAGLKVGFTSACKHLSWVKYLSHHPKKLGICDDRDKICWNYNTGAASIDLAIKLGATRVFLLGFDMKLSTGGEKHWHRVYSNGKVIKRSPYNQVPFTRHLKGFPAISDGAKEKGVQIFNVSPESAIKEFPKITLKEALLL